MLVAKIKRWCHLFGVALPREGVAFEAGLDVDVGDDVSASPALKGNLGGLRLDARSGNDDARDLNKTRHLKIQDKLPPLRISVRYNP
jgi:hypothetical protein